MHRSASSTNQYQQPSPSMENPLLEPMAKGRVEEVAAMVRQGEGRLRREQLDEALLRGAGYGQAELCDVLLSAGADPCITEERSERRQRLEGLPTFTGEQAKRRAWLDVHSSAGGGPLHRAVEGGHTATVATLLRHGARVNQPDDNGVTPLMLACMRRGSDDIAYRLLLTPGCAINIKEKRMGRTAMHFAAHVGDLKTLKLLVEQGGDVDVRDHLQNTPLMLASTSMRYEHPGWPSVDVSGCIQLLITNGAFVNLVNRDSETALQRALEIQNEDAVGLLLSNNALTHPSTLRDACLIYKDLKVIEKLLLMGGALALGDDTLCAILIILICDDSSQWMLNAKLDEQTTHKIAQLLILRVRDWSVVEEILSKNVKEEQNLFGDECYQAYHDKYKSDISKFGLFGAALKHGKYGVAKMLYLAGSDLRPVRALRKSSLCSYLLQQAWLSSWLPEALGMDADDDEIFAAENPVIAQYDQGNTSARPNISSEDILRVEAYDVLIREQEVGLLNQFYAKREESQAASYQLRWIYQ